ncbi:MAG: prepilin peptidase [Elusimicrobia bacterium]|nr:prepilin peptidase [Elusimicrobiota bacterium]
MNEAMRFPLLWVGFGCALGGIAGSFANVCIYRVPRGKSIVLPRSRCPWCHGAIVWYQNIPVISYLVLGGKCAHCQHPISVRYAVVELLMAGLVGVVFARAGGGGSGVVLGVTLTFVLMVISVIDLDWKIIPDVLSLGLFWTALVVSPLNSFLGPSGYDRVLSSGLGAAAGFGSAWLMAEGGRRVFRREALGGGDVKLLAGVGALMGGRGVLTTWFLASIFGTLVFAALKSRRKMNWGAYLPFGPFLAAGAWAHWVWPAFFFRWWGF